MNETGIIMLWPLPVAPSGWAIGDGSAISRADNAALFGIYGTTFGAGDGSTTFNLPDLRGVVVSGAGQRPPVLDQNQAVVQSFTARSVGDFYGSETATLAVENMPPHRHAMCVRDGQSSEIAGSTEIEGAALAKGRFNRQTALHEDWLYNVELEPDTELHQDSIGVAGGEADGNGNVAAVPVSVTQPTVALHYVVKL